MRLQQTIPALTDEDSDKEGSTNFKHEPDTCQNKRFIPRNKHILNHTSLIINIILVLLISSSAVKYTVS